VNTVVGGGTNAVDGGAVGDAVCGVVAEGAELRVVTGDAVTDGEGATGVIGPTGADAVGTT
jgi:hypothetical protein